MTSQYQYDITVPICIIEGTDSRGSVIKGYIPQLLKYQDFWCISCILKELYYITPWSKYYITEAPLDVLKVELLFIVGDLNFPTQQWFCLC